MSEVAENTRKILNQLPENVTLVAVSKLKPATLLKEVYDSGHKIFGENYVQEMVEKAEILPKDIEWNFIGHLQSNKVKYIAPIVSLIHSVDSFKLLKEINKQALKNQRIIPCLLQIHIAQEDTKTGMDEEELSEILKSNELKDLKNIDLRGLMGMSTFTDDMSVVRAEFKSLKNIFEKYKDEFQKAGFEHFTEISMGMSGDWKIAIEEGSTMVRIGSSIFGSRG
ncbi:MAG: YggS family pyridoxal phosphate-dependent enzyme [Cytophagaceae bacterium]|nr:YggS family pyridoxal phosphate-dependent enzyme [Cytophagaceae bacterium]